MKRFFKRTVLSALIAVLLTGAVTFGGFCPAANAIGEADKQSLNGTNWMSGIPDGRYLCEINLPGTHDSATAYCKNTTGNAVSLFGVPVFQSGAYAKTQTLTLSEQLDAGVRYLDLRLSAKDGDLLLCHGDNEKFAVLNKIWGLLRFWDRIAAFLTRSESSFADIDAEFYAYEDEACTVPFTCDGALTQIKDFLAAHPSETVIVTVKKENGDAGAFLSLLRTQVEALKTEMNPATRQAYLYTEDGSGVYTKMPTLSETRGKIVLMTPFYEELQAGDTLDAGNGAGQTDFMGTTFRYENHWSVTACLKTAYVERFLDKFSDDLSEDPAVRLPYANVLKTNASVVPLQSPRTIAEKVNGSLYRPDRFVKGRYYGWIMGDFMTEEICRTIWQTNLFVLDRSSRAA